MREFELIGRIQGRLSADPASVLLGSGDDAAHLEPGSGIVVTTDAIVSGVHFGADDRVEDVGFKAVAVNLSDIAAMGAEPWAMVATYGLPADTSDEVGDRLTTGLLEAADEHGVALVGGDIVRSATLFVSVTMLGRDVCGRVVTRAGGRPGDLLLVTGVLGGSLSSGRHLRPTARIAEGLALNRAGVTAMIDLSDGLAGDLARLAERSAVGAEIESARLPISPDAADTRAALCDGEDFELLVACPPAVAEELTAAPPFETRLTRIGRLLPHAEGLRLDGAPLTLEGYEHGR